VGRPPRWGAPGSPESGGGCRVSGAASALSAALAAARRVADGDAFSNLLLPSLLDRAGLAGRERALATELTYGTLRHLLPIDRALSALVRRPLERASPGARAALRLGAHQLLFMRIPAHAAVAETVSLVRPGQRSFVNAVLRRLAATPPEPPTGNDDEAVAARPGRLDHVLQRPEQEVRIDSRPVPRQVADGRLGKKSGQGFFAWE
jgi:transcription termination factor NusB